MKIPVSLLSTYLYCPRKVFLERVLRLKEPLRQPLVFGTIRHNALEAASNSEEEIICDHARGMMGQEDFFKIYQERYLLELRKIVQKHLSSLQALNIDPLDAYHKALPTVMREAKVRSVNAHQFMLHTRLTGPGLWDALTPKIRSEVALESEELHLTGIVDQVHDHGSFLIPFELKTGKAPRQGVWPGHRIQAAAYALLVEEKSNKPVKEAIVHYLDLDEKRRVAINPFMKDEVRMLVGEIMELLSNSLLPDHCSAQNKCASCGLRNQCYDGSMMQTLTGAISSGKAQARMR